MKVKWGRRKLLFMVIPEANRSVKRFKIPVLLLYLISTIIPLIILALIAAVVITYNMHLEGNALTYQLQTELANKADLYTETVKDKDKTISDLQNDVITLSAQADEVKSKIEELKALESELKAV